MNRYVIIYSQEDAIGHTMSQFNASICLGRPLPLHHHLSVFQAEQKQARDVEDQMWENTCVWQCFANIIPVPAPYEKYMFDMRWIVCIIGICLPHIKYHHAIPLTAFGGGGGSEFS